MDLIYDNNYILDYELEKPSFGFSVALSCKNFLNIDSKRHRLYRALQKESKKREAKIFAINCNSESIKFLIGNTSHRDLLLLIRACLSNFSHFINSLGEKKVDCTWEMALIRSSSEFKSLLYQLVTLDKLDLSTNIKNKWNSLQSLLFDNWEYKEMIDKGFLSRLYKCDKQDLLFSVFKLENIQGAEYQSNDLIDKRLSNYYRIPPDVFLLFPKTRKKIIKRSLNKKDLFLLLIYDLREEGLSFREIGKSLYCSHTKVYNAYKNQERI